MTRSITGWAAATVLLTLAPINAALAFVNCDAARAAGAAPVHVGEPGYGYHLDRDGDGVGCEPFSLRPTYEAMWVAPVVSGSSSSYRTCAAARAAGAAPVYMGQPGYGYHLDRDRDGVGCE